MRPVLYAFLAAAVLTTTATAQTSVPLPDRSILSDSEHAQGWVTPPGMLEELQARDPMYGYDVDHYHYELTSINFTQQTITARATLSITITEPDLQWVPFDFNTNSNALPVTGVTVNGASSFYGIYPEQVTVFLGATSPAVGTQLDIGISYSGHPQLVGNKSMRWESHSTTPCMYTLSTPYSTAVTTVIPTSHYWRPCKDTPTDKSTYSAALTVPDTMTGVTCGLLTSVVNNGNGTKTYNWEHDFEVAPYLITIAVTNFVEIQDEYVGAGGTSPVRHYVWPEDLADATSDWAVTVTSLERLASRYGEYPFIGDKYCMYESGNGGPAVEHQTAVSMPANLINGLGTYEWIVVHEMGHLWWGDAVTVADWAHVWLSEGFASYSEALFYEIEGGPSALKTYMQNMDSGPYAGTVYNPPYVWHSIVYDKGAWILHMLRHVMGDASFFTMLQGYQLAYQYGNVVTDDFVAAAEAAHGDDLSWFFDPWVYQEGRPAYEYTWWFTSAPESPTVTMNLQVDQVQSLSYPTYTMPIDVRLELPGGGTENHVIWSSERTQVFEIPVAQAPTDVTLDPDGWVLADFDVIVPTVPGGASTPAAFLAQNRPNPIRAGGTSFRFGLSRNATVALRVFDPTGRLVRSVFHGRLDRGEHEVPWDGRDLRGEPVASGAYVYQLVGPDGVMEKRLIVVR